MSEIVLLDAEGYLVNSAGERMKANRPPMVPRPKNPVAVTLENLKSLENAIYESGPDKRNQYLTTLGGTPVYTDLDNYLRNALPVFEQSIVPPEGVRKITVLKYFWNERGWRPSKDGKRILNANINPYLK